MGWRTYIKITFELDKQKRTFIFEWAFWTSCFIIKSVVKLNKTNIFIKIEVSPSKSYITLKILNLFSKFIWGSKLICFSSLSMQRAPGSFVCWINPSCLPHYLRCCSLTVWVFFFQVNILTLFWGVVFGG